MTICPRTSGQVATHRISVIGSAARGQIVYVTLLNIMFRADVYQFGSPPKRFARFSSIVWKAHKLLILENTPRGP
jgi:hypothetical protein